MSDQLRAAVAKAIYEDYTLIRAAIDLPEFADANSALRDQFYGYADAAIAAMRAHQPEPTEAEVEAAAEATWLCDEGSLEDHPLPWHLCCDRYPGTADRYRDMARAALIAARKEAK